MVKLLNAIGPPDTIEVVGICTVPVPPVTETSTSKQALPAPSRTLAHVAVPVASALESIVMAENV